mgnify:FL=1
METTTLQIRRIESKWLYFVLWLFFILLFYFFYWYYKPVNLSGTSSIYSYIAKYGIYIPIIIGILSILKSYILLGLFYIIQIDWIVSKILIYFLIYGFWLFFAIQLKYYEPRYTDIAIVIIDVYSLPLLIASSLTLVGVVFLSFSRKR